MEIENGLGAQKCLQSGHLLENAPGNFEVANPGVIIHRYQSIASKWLAEVLHESGGGSECPRTSSVQSTECVKGIDFAIGGLKRSFTPQLQKRACKCNHVGPHQMRVGDGRQKVEDGNLIALKEFSELKLGLQIASATDWKIMLDPSSHRLNDRVQLVIFEKSVADHEVVAENARVRCQCPSDSDVGQHTEDLIFSIDEAQGLERLQLACSAQAEEIGIG